MQYRKPLIYTQKLAKFRTQRIQKLQYFLILNQRTLSPKQIVLLLQMRQIFGVSKLVRAKTFIPSKFTLTARELQVVLRTATAHGKTVSVIFFFKNRTNMKKNSFIQHELKFVYMYLWRLRHW